jgi:hypothetical protein
LASASASSPDPTRATSSQRASGGVAPRRARDGRHTRIETDSHTTASATEFLVTHALDAAEGDERAYARTWTLTFPRDGV